MGNIELRDSFRSDGSAAVEYVLLARVLSLSKPPMKHLRSRGRGKRMLASLIFKVRRDRTSSSGIVTAEY